MGIIRTLLVKLGVDADTDQVKKFDESIDNAAKSMQGAAMQAEELRRGLAERIQTGALAASAAFGLIAHQTLQAANQTTLLADRLGISTDEMQRLGFAAGRAGQDMQTIHDAMQTLGERARDSLIEPTSDAAKQLKKLGLEFKDQNGQLKDNTTLFLDLADRLAAIKNPTDQAAAAMTLLGEDGSKLLPILKQGGDAIRAMGDDAERLGGVMSSEELANLAEVQSTIEEFEASTTALKTAIALELLPRIKALLDGFNDWITAGDNAEKATRALTTAVKLLAVALAVVVAAKAKIVFQQIIASLTVIVSLLQKIAIAMININKRILIAGIVIQMLIVLALLLEDVVVWLQGGDSLIGRFIEKFRESDSIFGSLARWLESMKPTFQVWLAIAQDFAQNVLPVLLKRLQEIGTALLRFLVAVVFPAVVKALSTAFKVAQALWQAFLDSGVFAAFQELAAELLAAAIELGAAFSVLFAELSAAAIEVFMALLPVVMMLVKGIVTAVRALLPPVIKTIKLLMQVVTGLVLAIVPILVKISVAIIRLVARILPLVVRLVSTLIITATKIITALVPVITGVVRVAVKIIAAVLPVVTKIISGIIAVIEAILPVIISIATWIFEKLGALFGWIIDRVSALVQTIGQIIGVVVDFFGPIASAVFGFIGDVVEFIVDKIMVLAEFMGGMAQRFKDFFGGIVDFISPAVDAVSSGVSSALNGMMSFMEPVIAGLKQAWIWMKEITDPAALQASSKLFEDFNERAANLDTIAAERLAVGGAASSTTTSDNRLSVGQVQVNVTAGAGADPGEIGRRVQQGTSEALGDAQRRQAARDLAQGG